MIEGINFQCFKSWRDTSDIKLGDITGLFGTNSSGKTSILQFILMLKETSESQDRAQVLDFGGEEERHYVNLGSFSDVAYKGDDGSAKEISWQITWSLPKGLEILDPTARAKKLFSINRINFRCRVSNSTRGLTVEQFAYTFKYRRQEYSFGMVRKPGSTRDGYDLECVGYDMRRGQGRAWPLPPPLKCYIFPDQVNAYYQNAGFLAQFSSAFQEMLSNVYYLGPLREYPKRQYTWAGSAPSDMGRRGEYVVSALLASTTMPRISRGQGKRRFTVAEYVAHWLKELGLVHSFRVHEISNGSNLYQIRVKQQNNSPEVLISEVGFGISQILPVLTICYYVPDNSTIILEQPEIHLHPLVQTKLADVFIDAVTTRNIKLIIESHSEHLLLRLQRRIAEEKIGSEAIKLYLCARDNGESSSKPLDLDEFGNIKNWPDDFFGDEFEERAAMMRSITNRQESNHK